MGWKRVLVLTYKPAVQTAWRMTCSATSTSRAGTSSTATPPIAEARAAAGRPRPARLVRVVPGPAREDRRRRGQGAQRVDPPDRLGLHRPRRVPLRRVARLGPRPVRPDRQGTRRGRGARRAGHRRGPRSDRRALPLPLRHAVPRHHQRRVHRGRDLQLDLRRRAAREGPLGRRRRAATPTSTCRGMEMYTYEMGARGRRHGPRTASSTASR